MLFGGPGGLDTGGISFIFDGGFGTGGMFAEEKLGPGGLGTGGILPVVVLTGRLGDVILFFGIGFGDD